MRLAPALLLLLAAPALAQDPIPDTTDAWLYFPLTVGSVWEYQVDWGPDGNYYDRWVIPRDTTVNGALYAVREEYRSNSDDTAWELQRVSLLRFDTLTTQVVRWTGSEEVFESCPFGADFNALVDCDGEDFEYGVYGGYLEAIEVGGEQAPALAWKHFYPNLPVDGDFRTYVAPIGFHHVEFWICTFCQHDLVYTRLVREDGTVEEYGEPLPVAAEPAPEPSGGLLLSAYPNPSTGAIALTLAVPKPQAVTVEVLDALGRRVHAEERAVSGEARLALDGHRWAPGVYVVRVTAEDGGRATARLVRQ